MIIKMFEVGDVVNVMDMRGILILEPNKDYIVVQTKINVYNYQRIALKGVESEQLIDESFNCDMGKKYTYFRSNRFGISIKHLRKIKLKKLC